LSSSLDGVEGFGGGLTGFGLSTVAFGLSMTFVARAGFDGVAGFGGVADFAGAVEVDSFMDSCDFVSEGLPVNKNFFATMTAATATKIIVNIQ